MSPVQMTDAFRKPLCTAVTAIAAFFVLAVPEDAHAQIKFPWSDRSQPDYADANYPQIDYRHPVFRQWNEGGYRFSGIWAIDGLETSAAGLAWEGPVRLWIVCDETTGETKAAFTFDSRIEGTPETRFRVTMKPQGKESIASDWMPTSGMDSLILDAQNTAGFLQAFASAPLTYIRSRCPEGDSLAEAWMRTEGTQETDGHTYETCGAFG